MMEYSCRVETAGKLADKATRFWAATVAEAYDHCRRELQSNAEATRIHLFVEDRFMCVIHRPRPLRR